MSSSKKPRSRRELQHAISLEWRRAQNRTDAYDQAVADALQVNRTDLRCIDILDQEGPTPAGKLAELMGLTTGATTALIDRLEQSGFVQRVRDPHDRRVVYVAPGEAARERLWPYYEPMERVADELYRHYTVAQLELLLGFLERGAELSERELERLRAELAGS
jgi:DNA-binding MarR family transcriptional regulator